MPQLTLGGGRQLHYEVYGSDTPDPGLPVVVSCHGGLSTSIDIAPAHEAARAAGVQIAAPDRPGAGGSDPDRKRTVVGWAADVSALADHLGATAIAPFGWSLGGQYALAVASGLPDRVVRTAVVGSVTPFDDETSAEEAGRLDRTLLRLSRRLPPAARLTFRFIHRQASRKPDTFTATLAKGLGDADAAVVRRDGGPDMAAAVAAATRDAQSGVQEYRLWEEPWGFSPADVRGPVRVWQGDDDHLVPMAWAERLEAQLPDAALVRCPGEGHFLAHDRWPEIIGWLATGR